MKNRILESLKWARRKWSVLYKKKKKKLKKKIDYSIQNFYLILDWIELIN